MSATAEIVRGKKTNRVKVKRKSYTAGTAAKRYRKDPATRGLDTALVCISMPAQELAVLDKNCEAAQMARSHYIRQAVKYYAAYVLKCQQSEQEKRWREAMQR